MKISFEKSTLVSLVVCFLLGTSVSAEVDPGYEDALRSWSVVLHRFVDHQGRVDFAGIRSNPEDLVEYLDYVAEYGPLSAPRDFPRREDRLAYYLNAYNALAMHKVIEFGIPKKITGLRKIRFFGLSRIDISGKRMSLHTLEKEYIRSEGDPRVHFALNCMAASCPRLPRTPFGANDLDENLDQLAIEFFSDPRNLRVDHENETVYATEILDFFPEDFLAHSSSLIEYINRYVDPGIPGRYSIEFIDYDWTVNAQLN